MPPSPWTPSAAIHLGFPAATRLVSRAITLSARGTAIGLISLAAPAAAGPVAQSITLRPGWNAIHLEVQPQDGEGVDIDDPALVFAGLPIASVWRNVDSGNPAQFLQSPEEMLDPEAGWLAWFPPTSEESFLTTLARIHAGRPYLVKLSGHQPATLVLSGRPVERRLRWAPGAFTLTGLPVDPAAPASFAQFFAASSAHAFGSEALLAYRLVSGGLEPARSDPQHESVVERAALTPLE